MTHVDWIGLVGCALLLLHPACEQKGAATKPAPNTSTAVGPPTGSAPGATTSGSSPEATFSAPTATASLSASASAPAPIASADRKRDADLHACCRAYSRYEMCNVTPCPRGVGKFYDACMRLYKKKLTLREALPALNEAHEKHVPFPMLPACNPDVVKNSY